MLIIADEAEVVAPCIVEVDPYVPLAFKTYRDVLAGARYFRVGNFDSSLLEIGVDPASLVIRKVTLVSFDRVLDSWPTDEERNLEEVVGLPVVNPASLSGDRTDRRLDFDVSLLNESFVIDWSHGKRMSKVVRFQRALFFLAGSELCRIAFCDLTSYEILLLKEHMKAILHTENKR